MRLNYTFLDSDGVAVNHLPVEVKDKLTGLPPGYCMADESLLKSILTW